MKSQTRAWTVFILLFLLWGTLLAAPFRYLADMVRELGAFLFIRPMIPVAWQSILIYLLLFTLYVIMLLIGKYRARTYIAGLCALAGMIHHLIYCLRTQQLYPVSPAIAVGLALALLFLLIRSQTPALWLSDAFIMSLPVYLLYDGLLSPLFSMIGLSRQALMPFMLVPAGSLIFNMPALFQMPQAVWSILPVLMAVLPMIWLTRGRKKG